MIQQHPEEDSCGRLNMLSALYLFLPWFIFGIGYLRTEVGVLLSLFLWIGLYFNFLKGESLAKIVARPSRIGVFFVCVGVSLLVIPLTGIGGLGYQIPDYLKHNEILHLLVTQDWPVVGSEAGTYLVFYFAWYLPAAVVGKYLGWQAAALCQLVYSWLGVLLVLLWLCRVCSKQAIAAVVLLFFVSGMDVIGHFLLDRGANFLGFSTLEWWASGKTVYFSFLSQLIWGPHQTIAAWLVTLSLLHALLSREALCRTYYFVVALSLWSPFAVIGLLPLLLACLRCFRYRTRAHVLDWVLLLALLVVISAFYHSRVDSALPTLSSELREPATFLFEYLLFVLVEFFTISLMLLYAHRGAEDSIEKRIAIMAVLSLLTIPLFQYGLYNDWSFRTSVPALLSLYVLTVRAWREFRYKLLVSTFIVIGSCTPLIEGMRGVSRFTVDLEAASRPLAEKNVQIDDEVAVRRQYFGTRDSLFFELLANREG